jgi:polysaccharide biosynthesis/export protein
MKKISIFIVSIMLVLLAGGAAAFEVVLGSGDVLKASVYGSPDLATEARVSDAGTITFPLLGQVSVGGLTIPAAEKKIGALLESGGFLRKAQVNIIVTLLQSQQISVLGQVNRPGRYPVDGRRSVMDMLALAGGMNSDGGDTISLIRTRNGVTSKDVIDVIEMIRSGDMNRDFDLAPNDVIYVERAPRFYIYGEVQRPGAFRLERGMTVQQALSVGGGLTPRGTERGLRVKRRDRNGEPQFIKVRHDDVLQSDDVVYVQESWF